MKKASWYKKKKENEDTEGKTQEGVSMPNSHSRKRKCDEKEQEGLKQSHPASDLFVERTKGGALAQKLKDIDPELQRMSGHKVKIVERMGGSYQSCW